MFWKLLILNEKINLPRKILVKKSLAALVFNFKKLPMSFAIFKENLLLFVIFTIAQCDKPDHIF